MGLPSSIRSVGVALVILLVVVPCVTAQNNGKLAGRVTDTGTGKALLGATVLLVGTGRGAVTNDDGRYLLLGVPVGVYDVQISYVGYQPLTIERVEINAGYTRNLDASLVAGVEFDPVVVTYERPLIRKDAIGVPRIVTAGEIENLPVRGVNAVAAIQPGVVNVEGRDELYVRGGRSSEVAHYIDGVKVIADAELGFGAIGLPQASIQEQEMLLGNISARYGDAMSGVINLTTRSGGPEWFGSLESLTSEGLDPYGSTLLSGSIGGPLVRNRLHVFAAGEFSTARDGNPRAVRQLRLDEAERRRLEQSPLVLPIITPDGGHGFVELPGDLAAGAQLPVDNSGAIVVNEDGTVVASDGSVIRLPVGATLASLTPLFGWEVVDPELFTLERARLGNGNGRFSGTANLTFMPSTSVHLRAGARQAYARIERIGQARVLFAPDSFTEIEDVQRHAFATWTHYLSPTTFYQVQVDLSDRRGWAHDPRFSRNVEDLLFYGDLDHHVNDTFARYKVLGFVSENRLDSGSGDTLTVEVPTYRTQFSDGLIGIGSYAGPPGGRNTGYEKFHHRQWRLSGSATTQLGVHQLEFGGEVERRVRRRWALASGDAHQLAAWFDDAGTCRVGECGAEVMLDDEPVTRYADLPIQAVRFATYYGYDYLGLEATDEQSILGYLDGTDSDIAPWRPRYYGGYVQDKIEYRDIVLNLGVRVDVFDNNALVYRDPFARVPIVRAGDVSNRPPGIGADLAVYFNGDEVAGYRDQDGGFFGPTGEEVPSSEVTTQGTPRLVEFGGDEGLRQQTWDDVFEDYEPQVTFMPRIGVTFPVTDRVLFFGRYGVVSQRPSEFNYPSLRLMLDRGDFAFQPNPGLKPERTIEYEIGFRHRVAPRAAFSLSGFFRQIRDLETIRLVEDAFPDLYFTPMNADFGTVKGLEFNFDLQRVRHLALSTNYTLSFAEGTGSNASSSLVASRSREDPARSVFPLDFDQRHRFNLSLDLRFRQGEGPALGSIRPLQRVGVNVLLQAASGFPYTASPLATPGLFRTPLGDLNARRMPASSRVDLRIDRRLGLGRTTVVSVFAWIQNLLGTQNVFGVYTPTGLPDEDGFRLTPVGEEFINKQLRPETADLVYDHLVRDPGHYGIPRLIRFGARISFRSSARR